MNLQALNYLYLFLGTIGIMSVLIMDEEVLLLLCWVLFICLFYIYGSTTVNVIFDEIRLKFRIDMFVSYDFQKLGLRLLIHSHIIQSLITYEVKYLFNFSKKVIALILFKRQSSFKFIIASLIEYKLSILSDKEAVVASEVQDIINSRVSVNVFNKFKLNNKKVIVFKRKILSESMAKFKTIVSY
jgi:hypothetical protein